MIVSVSTLFFVTIALLPPLQGIQETDLSSAVDSNELPSVISIEGLVEAIEEDSVQLKTKWGLITVRVTESTSIGLKLNKPWFDWESWRVYVDQDLIRDSMEKTEFSADGNTRDTAAINTTAAISIESTRIGFDLPAKRLHVISRFQRKQRLIKFLDQKENRISYYLVTPEDMGEHYPTLGRPFIAGPIQETGEQNEAVLQIDGKQVVAKLGFQTGTINGYTLAAMQPQQTWMILSGTPNQNHEIIASSLLFYPVKRDDR